MNERRWFKVGVAGTAVSAACCFTPVAVWGLAALGLGAAVAWLDWVLLPALVAFAVLTVVMGLRLLARRRRGAGAPAGGPERAPGAAPGGAALTLLWFDG